MKKQTEKIRIPKIGALIHDFALASSIGSVTGHNLGSRGAVQLLSPGGGTVTTSGGLTINTQSIDEVGQLDLLVIAAVWRDPRRV